MDFFDFARFASAVPSGFGNTRFDNPLGASDQLSSTSNPLKNIWEESGTERILRLAENSATYLKSGQYDEAFGLLQALYELGPDVQFATVLVDNYVTAMATDRPEKAKKSKEELHALIVEQFKVDAEDVHRYAQKLSLQQKFFKAVLFYEISNSMLKDEENTDTIIRLLHPCVAGLSESAVVLIEQKRLSKSNVKNHILPQLYEMTKIIESKRGVDRKQVCVFIGTSWRGIAQCENAVGEEEKELDALKKAINSFQSVLGKEAAHHNVFRECLKILAARHLKKERFREAAKAFSEAIDATKRANNFISPLVKRAEVKQLEESLFLVRTHLERNL